MIPGRTMYAKICEAHTVRVLSGEGHILLYVDQLKLTPKYTDIYQYPPLVCLAIGLFQMLALVPGVSRSGASIVGALLLGTDKRSAAEFSFFVAIPLMAGAFSYDLWKNKDMISSELGLGIAIGFATAFIAAEGPAARPQGGGRVPTAAVAAGGRGVAWPEREGVR